LSRTVSSSRRMPGGIPMPFPDADRVLYEINPLDEVICQVRFPPILKIDVEDPAGFQEEIRSEYPNYNAKSPVRLGGNVPPHLAELFAADLPFGGKKSHEFGSRDEAWKLSLSRQFLALTCKKYDRWENFRHRLGVGLEALKRHYAPTYFTRIGLRYQDVINRTKLGLADTPWSDLLKPPVAGLLGEPVTAASVAALQGTTILDLPGDIGKVQFQHALATHPETNEAVFVIDCDFFTEQQTEPTDVLDRLDTFNRKARLFFRWCITDTLHQAMRPGPVPST
jgi:uncharacterized protein (TIGR04255 family)